jgi:integrase
MAKPRKISLETPTARTKLVARKQPYFVRVAPHIALGYRRNESGFGTWSVRFADGTTSGWLKKFGIADDLEPADDKHVFSYDQALKQARKLARGEADTDTTASGFAPITVDGALTDYARDLAARGADTANANNPRRYLAPALLAKPVALLASKELRVWRDGLLADIKPASVNRLCKGFRAALVLAASHDQRIQNQEAWRVGLAALPDAHEARNVVLSDEVVRNFVQAAYRSEDKLGLFAEVLAVTGTRPSQATRLLVADLHGGSRPKLMMPKSGKGGGKNRIARKGERYSVPITPALAAKLKASAKGRGSDEPLLRQGDGQPWGSNPSQYYREDIREVVESIKLNPNVVTIYALRHSSIVRQLLLNVPVRLVAALHDTSVREIERTYSRHIADHGDDVARAALLHTPLADTVVSLAR